MLIEQGLCEDVEKARRYIMAGRVFTRKERRIDTAGQKLPADTELYIKGMEQKYVSRGGYKLEKALESFDVHVEGKIVLDIGSSTGGFTDAALQNGAAMCYALDVGTNQLAWKLRNDPRVVVMEQTNFRTSTLDDFTKGRPEFASIDVSFISLKLILPVLKSILSEDGDVVALIKPQFEAAKEKVGEKGIIRDPDVHREVLTDILSFAKKEGFDILGLDTSPITGSGGNVEFLAHLKPKTKNTGAINPQVNIDAVISSSQKLSKT